MLFFRSTTWRHRQNSKKTVPPEKTEKVKMQNVKAQTKFEKTLPPENKEKLKMQHVKAQAKFEKTLPPEKNKK